MGEKYFMIDFDEEVSRFEMSQETDGVEENILQTEIKDLADLLDQFTGGYQYEQ